MSVSGGLPADRPKLLTVVAWMGVLMPIGLFAAVLLGFCGALASGLLPEPLTTVLLVGFAGGIVTGLVALVLLTILAPFLRCAACNGRVLWTLEWRVHPQPYSSYGFGGAVAVGVNVLRGKAFACPRCGTVNRLPE